MLCCWRVAGDDTTRSPRKHKPLTRQSATPLRLSLPTPAQSSRHQRHLVTVDRSVISTTCHEARPRLTLQRSKIYQREREADLKSSRRSPHATRSPKLQHKDPDPDPDPVTAVVAGNKTAARKEDNITPSSSPSRSPQRLSFLQRLLNSPKLKRSEPRLEVKDSPRCTSPVVRHRSKQSASELRRAFSLNGSRETNDVNPKTRSVDAGKVEVQVDTKKLLLSTTDNTTPLRTQGKLKPPSPCSRHKANTSFQPITRSSNKASATPPDDACVFTPYNVSLTVTKQKVTVTRKKINYKTMATTVTNTTKKVEKVEVQRKRTQSASKNTDGSSLARRESVQEWVNSLPQDGALSGTGASAGAPGVTEGDEGGGEGGGRSSRSKTLSSEDVDDIIEDIEPAAPPGEDTVSNMVLEDDLKLGAEAKMMDGEMHTHMNGHIRAGNGGANSATHGGKMHLQRRLQFLQNQQDSFNSDTSKYESVDEILRERKGNPEEILTSLGFGTTEGDGSHYSRIPDRFLSRSLTAAKKGSMLEDFLVRNPDIKDYLQLSAAAHDSIPAEQGQGQDHGQGQDEGQAKVNNKDDGTRPPLKPSRSFVEVARTVALMTRFAGSVQTMKTLQDMPSILVHREHHTEQSEAKDVLDQGMTPARRRFNSILHPENRKFLVKQGLYDPEPEEGKEKGSPGMRKLTKFTDVVDAVRLKTLQERRLSQLGQDQLSGIEIPSSNRLMPDFSSDLIRRNSSGDLGRTGSPLLMTPPLSPRGSAPTSPCPDMSQSSRRASKDNLPERFLTVGGSISHGSSAPELHHSVSDMEVITEDEDKEDKDDVFSDVAFDLSYSTSSEDISPLELPSLKWPNISPSQTATKNLADLDKEKLSSKDSSEKEEVNDLEQRDNHDSEHEQPTIKVSEDGTRLHDIYLPTPQKDAEGNVIHDNNQNEIPQPPDVVRTKLAHLQQQESQGGLQSFELEEIQSADMVQDQLPSFGQSEKLKGHLVRTGSAQSDSSGFAESDAVDAEPDWELLKVAHLGSSAESESTASTAAGTLPSSKELGSGYTLQASLRTKTLHRQQRTLSQDDEEEVSTPVVRQTSKYYRDTPPTKVTLVDRSELFMVIDKGEIKHMTPDVGTAQHQHLNGSHRDADDINTYTVQKSGKVCRGTPYGYNDSQVYFTDGAGFFTQRRRQENDFSTRRDDKQVSRLKVDIQHTATGQVYIPVESSPDDTPKVEGYDLDTPKAMGHGSYSSQVEGHDLHHYYQHCGQENALEDFYYSYRPPFDVTPPYGVDHSDPGQRSWHWAHECPHQRSYYPAYQAQPAWDVSQHQLLCSLLRQSPYVSSPQGEQWPSFGSNKAISKQHLVEEVKLVQHALQKYKLEFRSLEIRANRAYEEHKEHLSKDEREQMDVVVALRSEVAKEMTEMEKLVGVRMRSIIAGGDAGTDQPSIDLASLNVIQEMIELLKEQVYHANLVNGLSMDGAPSHPLLVELESTTTAADQQYGGTSIMEQLMLLQKQIESQQSQTTSTLTTSFRELRSTLLDEIRSSIHAETQQLKLQVSSTENQLESLKRTINQEGHSALSS